MEIIIIIAGLIFSVILHEVMHGYVAEKLGDHTARLAGRLTLNPIPHIDPIFTILLPLLLFISSGGQFIFGAAKPVPVNPLNFSDWKKDMAIVSLAGPLTNIAIALVLAGIYHLITPSGVLIDLMRLNIFLAILNLIPIPPLDGSKIIAVFLPDHIAAQYESIGSVGMILLFVLLMMPIGGLDLGSLLSQLVLYSLGLLGI